jgi:hypothetical protein
MPDPASVAEHRGSHAVGLLILGQESAAPLRLHAQNGEECARDVGADDRLRRAAAGQTEAGAAVHRHLLERAALLREVAKVGGRDRFAAAGRTQLADERQPLRLIERQRPQRNAADDGVHGRIRPNAEGEHDERRHREGRAPPQSPGRVAKVLKQCIHDVRPAAASIAPRPAVAGKCSRGDAGQRAHADAQRALEAEVETPELNGTGTGLTKSVSGENVEFVGIAA